MATKKVLVVFGATGSQGGSVVNSILSDPNAAEQFHIRAVTRDPTKPNAKKLADQGAELISADLDDKDSLRKALHGAYAVFAVTNYWEKMDANLELQQGKNVADVAKEVGVQHLVWSSLLNVTKLSGGKLAKVYHFDSKAEVEEYIRSINVPASFFLAGFYMPNIPGQVMGQDPESHTWTFALPIPTNSPIPLFAPQYDTGKFVKGILLNREKTLGKQVYGATAYATCDEIIDTFKEVYPEAGKGAKAVEISHDAFKQGMAQTGAPEFVQEELLENMRMMPEYGYFGGAKLDESHSIVDEPLTTWKEYIAKDPAFKDLK